MILHLLCAFVAGLLTGTSPAVLMAIANHESRFTSNHVTAEPGRRVSCGVMTPYPTRGCQERPLLEQYLDGARHLRTWMNVRQCRDRSDHDRETCALLGYAAGYAGIRRCRGRVCGFPELIRRGGVR